MSSWWLGFRMQFYRYLLLLRRRWWIPFLTTSLGLAVAAVYVHNLPPSYLSIGRMMVSGKINVPEGGAVYSEELMNFFGTQTELMQSGEVKSRALARAQAMNPEVTPEKVTLKVDQQPKTSMFIFKAISANPVFTQLYLQSCMEEYMRMKKEMRSEKSETAVTALSSELISVEKELRKSEDELLEFQRVNNLGYLREEGNSAGLYLANLNRQLAELKNEHQLLEMLKLDQILDRSVEGKNTGGGSNEVNLNAFGAAAEYLKTRQQSDILKAEREQLSQYMRPKHPDIVRLTDEIARMDRLIETFREQSVEVIKNRRDGLALQIANLETTIRDTESKALDLSRRIAEYDKIRSKVDRFKAQYDRLFSNLRGVDVTRTVDQDMISVLERASAAISVKPGLPKAIGLGLGLGLLLGLTILFVLDRIDDRLNSFLDVQNHFTDPLLGQICREQHPAGPLELLHSDDPRHGFAESFRSLRSSLFYMPVEGERPKAFLITSAVPSEGKSTVSANLAITIALSGVRTLLIDGDMRRGAQHHAFGVANDVGLAEVLQSQVRWSEAVVPTTFENLSLLTRGGAISHPGERLLSPVTDRFLKEIYAAYDYIIFDSAPVLVADDTGSVAPKLDAVICVVRFGHSSARLSRRVIDDLKHRQANVIGLVFNDVDISMPDYGYHQYTDEYHSESRTRA
jgi:capsular exopolysaccharide synthesis family protein